MEPAEKGGCAGVDRAAAVSFTGARREEQHVHLGPPLGCAPEWQCWRPQDPGEREAGCPGESAMAHATSPKPGRGGLEVTVRAKTRTGRSSIEASASTIGACASQDGSAARLGPTLQLGRRTHQPAGPAPGTASGSQAGGACGENPERTGARTTSWEAASFRGVAVATGSDSGGRIRGRR